MQAVREFDENDPDIFSHGQGHFLKIFSLSLGSRLKHAAQLADPIDQFGDLNVEFVTELSFGDPSVLNDIMQKCGHQALMVHMHIGQDARYRKRVVDVGFTRFSKLSCVGMLGKVVGTFDLFNLVRSQIVSELRREGLDGLHS